MRWIWLHYSMHGLAPPLSKILHPPLTPLMLIVLQLHQAAIATVNRCDAVEQHAKMTTYVCLSRQM